MDMHTLLQYLAAALAAYLIGSIPFGYLAGRLKGVDIRTVGSGNIGATNVFRTLGKKFGITVFVLDVLKGVVAVQLVPQTATVMQLLCAVFVIVGHSFPVFLNFKGGKGVATGLGIAIGIAPVAAAIGFAVWLVLFIATRYVSVASIFAALTVGVCPWILEVRGEPRWLVPTVVSVLAALVIVKHKSNIARLLAGTENRFSFSKKKS